MNITASKLYDYFQCPHKVWRDQYGPQDEKIKEINPFVELLWNRGVLHEQKFFCTFEEFVDLSQGTFEERLSKTIGELKKGTSLLYQGVIKYENLLGVPDLIRKVDDYWIPVDIKSGKGVESGEDDEKYEGKPKVHYAIQLCHYNEILKALGFKTRDKGIIIDISGKEIEYNLRSHVGLKSTKTFTDLYFDIKNEVSNLLQNIIQNKPALTGICKLCPWYYSCKKWVYKEEDLTMLFYLGRSKRDILNRDLNITKVSELVNLDMREILKLKSKNKHLLKGISEKSLLDLVRRAKIMVNDKKPEFRNIHFTNRPIELFFDIEDDPTQDFVYLHGIYKRDVTSEKYLFFLAEDQSSNSEKKAWSNFWDYIKSLHDKDYTIYYYSFHEKTTYKSLQRKYPDIIGLSELNYFFNSSNWIDLYQMVIKNTDWPLSSYSLKDIAKYLGFNWRDENPSGAQSIQWYNDYLKSKNRKIIDRILKYNEDDCKATMVLKDALLKGNI